MASGAAATNQGHTSGQPHDRIPVGIVSLPATDDEETEQHIEVSIGSRMLSAVIGSVLTSLLGMSSIHLSHPYNLHNKY